MGSLLLRPSVTDNALQLRGQRWPCSTYRTHPRLCKDIPLLGARHGHRTPRSPAGPHGDLPAPTKLDLTITQTNPEHALTRYLLYYLMPLWTAAAVLDWYWHKRTDIEHTSGVGESLIHALMFTEAGVPIILGLLLEINAGLLSAMAATLIVHEATAIWDVSYATDHRHVKPSEQHTHSFLKVLPFMALSMASALHWDQLQSIFSIGNARPDWKLRLKSSAFPAPTSPASRA